MTAKEPLCEECRATLPWIEEPGCTICGQPFVSTSSHPCGNCLADPPPFDWHRSPLKYEQAMSLLIHSFKFKEGLTLTSLLSSLIFEKFAANIAGTDFLIPVPLASKRLRGRTYNQSLELAKGLQRLSGIPVLPHSLQKKRETLPQTALKRKDREKNLRDCFVWRDKRSLEGKKVILIDDVYTTGSTMTVLASLLRQQKPAAIGALTLAMTL